MTWPPPSLLRGVSAVVLVTAALGGASAASLGGINAGRLSAWTIDVDIDVPPPPPPPPPPPGACTDFEGSGSINGYPAGCNGGTWSTTGGNWHMVQGKLKANAGASIAWVPGSSPFSTVAVDVIGTDKKNREGGLVLSYDTTTGSHLLAIMIGPDRIELRGVTSGGTTVLGSVQVNLPDDGRLVMTRSSTGVAVSLDGVPMISTALGSTAFPGTSAGLFHAGGPAVDFDDFSLTTP